MSLKRARTYIPSGKMLIAACVMGAMVVGVGLWALYMMNRSVIELGDKESVNIYIPTEVPPAYESRYDYVEQLLMEQCGLNNAEPQLSILAQLKHYKGHVKPGCYKIENHMSANDIINRLRSGVQVPVNITFNNIRTLQQLAGVASRNIESDSTDLISAMTDSELHVKYGFTQEQLPAMFIPDTYQFMWNTSGKQWMERMNAEYKKFWNAERMHKADSLKLKPHEVSIIASIIEEESNMPDELPIIAGLYINRLRIHMPMQACPTVKFAVGDFTLKRVLTVHTQIDSPYNTYKYAGLPPGPIRIPSKRAIDAVLNAADHDYLFMCARPDGSGRHNFAKTAAQHARNAAIYQQELNRKKIYK